MINHQHLYYFWTVAREGSVTRAGEKLRLSQPTLSAQIRVFENFLGEQLFRRTGKRLELTEVGITVFRYADEIFSLTKEMQDTLKGYKTHEKTIHIGVADYVPKILVARILSPIFDQNYHVVCREKKVNELLADLATFQLDLVIADLPASSLPYKVKVFSHFLGECGVSLCGSRLLMGRKSFPALINGAPMLLPPNDSLLRQSLDFYFESKGLTPIVVGEIDDSALIKVLGEKKQGFFVVPTAIEKEVCRQYKVCVAGRINQVKERFYALSVERKIKNQALLSILESAKGILKTDRSGSPFRS